MKIRFSVAYTCARVWLFVSAFVRIVHISGVNSYGTRMRFQVIPVSAFILSCVGFALQSESSVTLFYI